MGTTRSELRKWRTTGDAFEDIAAKHSKGQRTGTPLALLKDVQELKAKTVKDTNDWKALDELEWVLVQIHDDPARLLKEKWGFKPRPTWYKQPPVVKERTKAIREDAENMQKYNAHELAEVQIYAFHLGDKKLESKVRSYIRNTYDLKVDKDTGQLVTPTGRRIRGRVRGLEEAAKRTSGASARKPVKVRAHDRRR